MNEHALAEWLPRQRWSGLRGEVLSPNDVRLVASIPFGAAATFDDVAVETHAGRVRFAVPLHDGDDATQSETFRLGVARAIADGGRWPGDGASLVAEPEPGGETVLRSVQSSVVARGEQSNTSIVYDDRVIVKLFRRLEAGTHPDVEVTRFLTRHAFPHTPRLLGTLALEDGEGTSVVAMAQHFVAGARDVWTYTVAQARAAALDGADVTSHVADAERLGRVTRALHDTLASDARDPAFAPRPANHVSVERWANAATASVEAGLALYRDRQGDGSLGTLPPHARDAALAAVRQAVSAIGDDVGAETRHHGDYHLGQILKAPDGTLFVIDFEGEPAKSLAERRAHHSPLRDVAGMLRSLAYAAATAAHERPGDAAVAARADAWERASRDALLAGYFDGRDAAYLPRSRASADALLALFELEKAFYELQYELRNRPTWVPIPLAGIARVTMNTL